MSGETTQPAPQPAPAPQPTSEYVAGGARIIEEAARAEGITDAALIQKAKEQFWADKRATERVTHEALSSLAAQISAPAGTAETGQDTINRILLVAERAAASERFRKMVRAGSHDFEGDDSNETELEANPVFQYACGRMDEFFANTSLNWPINFQAEWMRQASDLMTQAIAEKDTALGRMNKADVDKAIESIHSKMGDFEKWFKERHKKDYDAFLKTKEDLAQKQKQETEQRTKTTAELGVQKKALADKMAPLETTFAALPVSIMPAKLSEAVAKLKTDIGAATDASALAALETQMQSLEVNINEIAALKSLAEDPDIPQEKKDPILLEVREGRKTPADAKTELETEKQTAQRRLEQTAAEDAPIVDKLLAFANGLEEGGLKKALLGIATALTTLSIGLAKAPLIGKWIRGNLVSNKILAEQGDETARLAIKAEQTMLKFGLPAALANAIGDKKTKDVYKLITEKPAEITTDAALQTKLAAFAVKLKEKGGDVNDATLFAFLNANQIAPAATAAETPAQAQAPAETPQQKRMAKLNESFGAHQGITAISADHPAEFDYPYIDNSEIKTTKLRVYPDKLEIGDNKYSVKLPHDATLTKIEISGTVQAGSATLTAGKLVFSDSQEIPLNELVAHIDALRAKHERLVVGQGDKAVTFEPTAAV